MRMLLHMPMPAFSLYITDDRLSFVKQEAARLGVSQAKFVSLLIDQYRKKSRPQLACVGRDRQAWTPSMPLEEAVKAHAAALAQYPGLVIYLVPEGETIAQAAVVPEEWTEHAPGL